MVVIFQHIPSEGPGLIGEMIEGRGIHHVIVESFNDDPLPLSPAGFSAAISMGGPMSVNDRLPFLEKEKSFLTEAVERQIPVLGVCLGAQLLASALGASVKPGTEPEVGWGEVSLTQEGRKDRLFLGSEDSIPVLHWHGETFDLPEKAVLLASSPVCENQAFRCGDFAYGFQFHLETTREMVEEWIREDEISECGLGVDSEVVRTEAGSYLQRTALTGSLVFGRFLDLLRRP